MIWLFYNVLLGKAMYGNERASYLRVFEPKFILIEFNRLRPGNASKKDFVLKLKRNSCVMVPFFIFLV